MKLSIHFKSHDASPEGALCLAVFKDNVLSPEAKTWDQKTDGLLTKAMNTSTFKGEAGQTLTVVAPANLDICHIVLVGVGAQESLSQKDLEAIGGHAVKALLGASIKKATLYMDSLQSALNTTASMALGALLRSWHFLEYFTKKKPHELPALVDLTFLTSQKKEAEEAFEPLQAVASGVFFTRKLVSEPANIINPKTLAEQSKKLEKLGVKVTILDEKKLKELGMHALLGVGQGSVIPPSVVVMEYYGASDKKDAPVAFVGKGVTFDSGGISIKPAQNMEDMKWDMGGAATVMGLMKALAGRKAKVNAVGVAGIVENMPSGSAQRPGDVVKSLSGQTIEVINTDAEGRLVLADALWYTQETFKPKFIVDLATLTGAIIVSLGMERAGLFANDDKLAEQIHAAGESLNELVWRMPLDKAYDKEIDSVIADMKNVGSGRGAGSITAAKFLERFIQEGCPWAHLDIAGMAWDTKEGNLFSKGATGFGVRLLDRLVADHYEG